MNSYHIPDLVILELGNTLQQMTETLYRSYEHVPDISVYMVEQELDDSMDRIFSCITQRDIAQDSLKDMVEAQCAHDMEYDQGEFLYAFRMGQVGQELIRQFHELGMYHQGEFLPYAFRQRMGDSVVMQRIGYRGEDDHG